MNTTLFIHLLLIEFILVPALATDCKERFFEHSLGESPQKNNPMDNLKLENVIY